MKPAPKYEHLCCLGTGTPRLSAAAGNRRVVGCDRQRDGADKGRIWRMARPFGLSSNLPGVFELSTRKRRRYVQAPFLWLREVPNVECVGHGSSQWLRTAQRTLDFEAQQWSASYLCRRTARHANANTQELPL